MKKSYTLLVLFTLSLAACPLLTGCGKGTESSVSKEEATHFKGGPMPPEAQKAIAAQMQGGGPKGGPGAGAPPSAAPDKP